MTHLIEGKPSVYGRQLIPQEDNMYLVQARFGPYPDEPKDYLYKDEETGHWLYFQQAAPTIMFGEGLFKDQPIYVHYSYRVATEKDPLAMHRWVMNLVKSLEINQPIKE